MKGAQNPISSIFCGHTVLQGRCGEYLLDGLFIVIVYSSPQSEVQIDEEKNKLSSYIISRFTVIN
jgi:hypothetical protein